MYTPWLISAFSLWLLSMALPLPHPRYDKSRFDRGTLLQYFARFLWNRGGLMLLMPVVTIGLRTWLHFDGSRPWAWWELLLLLGLLPWPLYERFVHGKEMHTWQWDPLFEPHQRHHKAPFDAEYGIVPVKTILFYLAVASLLMAFRLSGLLVFFTGVLVVLSVYEWCHYLIHTKYKFRTRWGRAMYFNHRRHHWNKDYEDMGLLFPPFSAYGKAHVGTVEPGE